MQHAHCFSAELAKGLVTTKVFVTVTTVEDDPCDHYVPTEAEKYNYYYEKLNKT
jgi:hypothetical protein